MNWLYRGILGTLKPCELELVHRLLNVGPQYSLMVLQSLLGSLCDLNKTPPNIKKNPGILKILHEYFKGALLVLIGARP